MKILVFSDSHGDHTNMKKAIRRHKDAETIVFCGDGHRDIAGVRADFPDKAFYVVRGNCDWNSSDPLLITVTLCGKKLLITHGHGQFVKEGLSRLIALGHKEKADIVLFGHTHSRLNTADNRMLIMNPGSVGFAGQYGVIEIDEATGRITANEYPSDNFGPVVIT